jgi:GDPmannose 4,6-dehydratase
MKTALITGITGQDGSYLAKYLLEKNYYVIGISRSLHSVSINHKYLNISEKIELIEADLLDISSIIKTIEKYQPEEIYNFASQSSVGLSFEQPIGTLEFNIISVANLLEAIKIVNPKIKFYHASSSEMFGKVREKDLPIKEDFVFQPVSPYAISKATSHWIARNYREAYGMFAVCGILFNHESVLRRKNFVTKKIINSAVLIKEGELKELKLGNLNIYRDWGYAPKYIEAMWQMLNAETPQDYIICSGESNSLKDFLTITFNELNLDIDEFVRIDESLYRPVELDIIYGSPQKAKENLNWIYDLSFKELIKKLIEEEKKFIEWERVHFS